MAVLSNTGTQTPVIGSETTVATIAPGVPLDNISVYFVGGTGGGGGPLLLRLYAEVGGFQTLVAIKQAVGSNLPSIIAWDTGLGPLAGGGGGGRGGGNAEAQSNQIHAGGTNYTVTVEDLSNVPASLASPRQPVTITIAGVDQFDTVADAEFGTTFALAPGATGTLTVFPGYAQLMDVAIDQTNIPPFVTVTVTADCGGGSVVGALVASAQMSGTDSTIGEVFSELKLPVATRYFVSMRNNSQQAVNITLTGVTSSVAVTGSAAVVNLTGNVNGPSNANRWTSLVLANTFAVPATVIPVVGLVPGDGWWYVAVTGAASNRTVTLPAAPSSGEVVVVTDESGLLATNTITVNGNGNNVEGVGAFVMDAAYPGADGSICLQFDGTAWFIFADYTVNATSSDSLNGNVQGPLGNNTIVQGVGSIIYRPGAASAADHVATWPEVQTLVAAWDGKCIVYVDDSIVSPAIVPGATGITDFRGRGEIRPYRTDVLNYSTLVVQDGATLKSLYRLSGTIEIFAATTGVVPAFDFDYSANVVGTPVPILFLDAEAFIGTTAAQSAPAIIVPAAESLTVQLGSRAGIFLQGSAFFINLAAANSFLVILANDNEIVSNGSTTGDLVNGPGSLIYQYDSNTLNANLSPVAPVFAVGTFQSFQTDTHLVEIIFNASTNNVLAAISELSTVGTIRIDIEGFGGTGGGGGGQGGAVASPGAGGGASGGCQYTVASFDHNLADRLDVVVGAGGAFGAAGAAAGGAGGSGGDGSPSYALDFVTSVVHASLPGSSGGVGGALLAPGLGGANFVPGVLLATNVGFPAGGGKGGAPGASGVAGSSSFVTLARALGGTNAWAGGGGGVSVGGQGGGGGGGGAGPFADGGVGGASAAGNGNPGTSSTDNLGEGAGGGAGGTGNANTGGVGGTGKLGWVKLSFIAP